jgi:excisionase family DNA binding protein
MTMGSPYVTVREASHILGVSEGKLMTLVDEKKLQAYKIAGQYVRFKREDVLRMKSSGLVESETVKFAYTLQERFWDFVIYNDFYIISFVIVLVLLYIIFFGK